jgi:acetamidase/formamidase
VTTSPTTSTHTVEATTDTVRSGYLDPTAPPVATIDSDDVVSYPNTWTHWGNEATFGMTFAEREPLRHRYPNGPYSMMGPVEITGAEPGDTVECQLLTLRPRYVRYSRATDGELAWLEGGQLAKHGRRA